MTESSLDYGQDRESSIFRFPIFFLKKSKKNPDFRRLESTAVEEHSPSQPEEILFAFDCFVQRFLHLTKLLKHVT